MGSIDFGNGSLFNAEIGSALNTDADKLFVSGLASTSSGSNLITLNITGNVMGYLAGAPVSDTLLESDSGSTLTTNNFALHTAGFTSNFAGTWTHTFISGNLTVTFDSVPEPAIVLKLGAIAGC